MERETSRETRTRVMSGCTADTQARNIARPSSPRLRIQLLTGSGLALTAIRVEALLPWDVRATLPARRAAAKRHSSETLPTALYASRAARSEERRVGKEDKSRRR